MGRGWFGSELRYKIELASREYIHIPQNPPNLILIVGPCRSGTTALSNAFARIGITTDEQPRKSIGRALVEGSDIPHWNILETETLASKETLGPNGDEFFDPTEGILELGYPAAKIHVIGITREPVATLSSQHRMWGSENIDTHLFEQAYSETLQIVARSRERGIRTTHYVHEALRDNSGQTVTDRLSRRLGIAFDPKAADWSQGPIFGEAGSNVVFYDNPPEKFIKEVRQAGGYAFQNSGTTPNPLLADALRGSSVFEIYDYFKDQCKKDLGIDIY